MLKLTDHAALIKANVIRPRFKLLLDEALRILQITQRWNFDISQNNYLTNITIP